MFRSSPTLSLDDIAAIVDWECTHLVPQAQFSPDAKESYKQLILHLAMCRVAGEDMQPPEQFLPLEIKLDNKTEKEDNKDIPSEKETSTVKDSSASASDQGSTSAAKVNAKGEQ